MSQRRFAALNLWLVYPGAYTRERSQLVTPESILTTPLFLMLPAPGSTLQTYLPRNAFPPYPRRSIRLR